MASLSTIVRSPRCRSRPTVQSAIELRPGVEYITLRCTSCGLVYDAQVPSERTKSACDISGYLTHTCVHRLRQAIAWPIHTISLILDLASSALGCLAARIAGDDCRVDLCTSLRCPLLRVWSAGYEFGKPTAKIRRTRTKDGGLSRLSDFPPMFCRDFPSLHSSPWRPH